MDTSTMTLRLDLQLKERLERLSKVTQRSRSFLAAQAIKDYVELNEWQLEELESAVAEADEGDFASKEKVDGVLTKWA